jgi:hypothetical protein
LATRRASSVVNASTRPMARQVSQLMVTSFE